MDITQDIADAKYTITSYNADCIFVNKEPYHQSLLICPESLISPWDVSELSQLNETTLTPIIQYQPEIVIIGTGDQLVLPEPKVIAYFAKHKIGLETMNTPAACRTYGILAAEARKVMTGIIFNAV